GDGAGNVALVILGLGARVSEEHAGIGVQGLGLGDGDMFPGLGPVIGLVVLDVVLDGLRVGGACLLGIHKPIGGLGLGHARLRNLELIGVVLHRATALSAAGGDAVSASQRADH